MQPTRHGTTHDGATQHGTKYCGTKYRGTTYRGHYIPRHYLPRHYFMTGPPAELSVSKTERAEPALRFGTACRRQHGGHKCVWVGACCMQHIVGSTVDDACACILAPCTHAQRERTCMHANPTQAHPTHAHPCTQTHTRCMQSHTQYMHTQRERSPGSKAQTSSCS